MDGAKIPLTGLSASVKHRDIHRDHPFGKMRRLKKNFCSRTSLGLEYSQEHFYPGQMFIPSIIRRLSLCQKSISTLPFPPSSDRSGDRLCGIGIRKWQDNAFGSQAISSTLSLGHCAGIRGVAGGSQPATRSPRDGSPSF